ncbi:yjbr [Akkermansia glycaniphila]|uniref:Yjbr n=2 Tax=Akkermansia glycaniphila TaxID=1679444 RepID=A0A1H6MB55_9BACT|nr:yjbr [Akkermansia glycaniphila]
MDRQLRKEFEEELWHVAECCFEPDVFKHELTKRLIAYVQASYGDDLEYLWRRSPESAVVRRRDSRKWYAVFLMVPRLKLGGDSGEPVEVLNLRLDPCELERYVDGVSRFPAYHMNKKSWVSLCLDGSVPFEELAERLDASYRLALK